jgi:hypothetical protein
MIIDVNVMLIYVNNIDKKCFKKILIYVNFMIIYINLKKYFLINVNFMLISQTDGQTKISKV